MIESLAGRRLVVSLFAHFCFGLQVETVGDCYGKYDLVFGLKTLHVHFHSRARICCLAILQLPLRVFPSHVMTTPWQ